jgi:hypothetical protein
LFAGERRKGRRKEARRPRKKILAEALLSLPQRPRFSMPGIEHRITQRGDIRRNVFSSDQDWYLEMLGEHSPPYLLPVLGWF